MQRSPPPVLRRRFFGPSTAGLGIVFVWSTCFVAIKGTEGLVPPLLYAALRALAAAFLLVLVAAPLGRLRPPKGSWPWLFALALTSTTLALAGMFLGVGLAGPTLSAVLANTQPLLAAPLAALLFGERFSPAGALGLGLGLLGVALTLGGSVGNGSSRTLGLFLALASAVGMASGNLLMRYLAPRVDALTAVTWQYTIGGAALLLWSRLAEGPAEVPWSSLRFLLGLAYLGLVASAGASLAWYLLLRKTDLNPLNALTLLTPALSATLGWVLFREKISAVAGVGIGATLLGVALASSRLGGRKRSTAEPP
ncbi:MAG: DMT family transporter [Acidobacteria bacterium]|nr:DMT family transporter [Acidobacteriota bacterium]